MSVYEHKKAIVVSACLLTVLVILAAMAFFRTNKLYESITVEAGTKDLPVSMFIKNDKYKGNLITEASEIDTTTPGEYMVKILIGRITYSSMLIVEDTIAPTAESVNQEIWAGEELAAEVFVKNIEDVTDVNVSYKQKPDFSKPGNQEVLVMLEDTSGNTSQISAVLTIIEDTEPPQIHGVENHTVYVGDTIAYRRGVSVTDNRDEHIELHVDSSAVNLRQVGKYQVIYSATDKSGNTTEQVATITVREKPKATVSQQDLNEKADKVLAGIIYEGMSEIDKAWEIFKWTRRHLTYTGTSDKSDWMQEAYRAIQIGNGDCFTYYATARALLTRAGFENMLVTRESVGSRHYWNLVKVGGDWYHFDSGPYRRGYPFNAFLRTDKEVLEYSQWCIDYYKFDSTKYPSTPIEPLDHHRSFNR